MSTYEVLGKFLWDVNRGDWAAFVQVCVGLASIPSIFGQYLLRQASKRFDENMGREIPTNLSEPFKKEMEALKLSCDGEIEKLNADSENTVSTFFIWNVISGIIAFLILYLRLQNIIGPFSIILCLVPFVCLFKLMLHYRKSINIIQKNGSEYKVFEKSQKKEDQGFNEFIQKNKKQLMELFSNSSSSEKK